MIGDTTSADVFVLLGVPGLLLLAVAFAVVQRIDSRRRAAAEASGAFGATCNVYFENVKEIRRFKPLVSEVRTSRWMNLPSTLPPLERSVMGGALRIDGGGLVWTPSHYRQRKGMPSLQVPLREVESLERHRMLAIKQAGMLHVRLRHDDEWLLSMQDSDEALSYLEQLGCQTS